ncbi:hypothetical protein ACTFIY_003598 [Dictyostelium cf. discoideum]
MISLSKNFSKNGYSIIKKYNKISSPKTIIGNPSISIKSLSPSSSSSSSFIFNNTNDNNNKIGTSNTLNIKRFYSEANNKNNNVNQDKKQQQQQQQQNFDNDDTYHNKEEFTKPPKYFYAVALLAIGCIGTYLVDNFISFSNEQILRDIKTILKSEDALERNNALKSISTRAGQAFCVEKVFKLGVVEVLVKALDDPDPIVQATAIKTLNRFSYFCFETFGDEAVKKGACEALTRIMLSDGMNCEAASNLWFHYFLSKTNQIQLLTSNDLLYCLQNLAYSDKFELQRISIATVKILFANRELYPMLNKLKGMISHLNKSQDVLISNHAEYYLNVLKGEYIPPVGNISLPDEELDRKFKIHSCYNLLLAPLTYLYCCSRWKKYTRDPIYLKAKGIYGGTMMLLAAIVSSLTLFPDYHPSKINARLKKEFSLNTKTIEEFERCKAISLAEAVTLFDKNKNNNNNSSDIDETNEEEKKKTGLFGFGKSQEEKEKEKEEKERIKREKQGDAILFSPNSLFAIKQASPILTYSILFTGWKHARFMLLPALALLLPQVYDFSV